MTGGDHTGTDDAAEAFAFEQAKLQNQIELRREKLARGRHEMKARLEFRRQKFEDALALYRQKQTWADRQADTEDEEGEGENA